MVQEETGGIPAGFFQREEGFYQMRPSDGEGEIPVRLCSPVTAIELCSRSDGSCWGREDAERQSITVSHEAQRIRAVEGLCSERIDFEFGLGKRFHSEIAIGQLGDLSSLFSVVGR